MITSTIDIVQRLREFNDEGFKVNDFSPPGGYHPRLMDEAADEIIRLREEIKKLQPKEPGKSEWVITPESSNISGFGYDPKTKDLTVAFGGSSKYAYHQVPQEVFDLMKKSESKGKFHGVAIKGVYQFTKVD